MMEDLASGKLKHDQDKLKIEHEEKKWNAKVKELEYKTTLFEKYKTMRNEMPKAALVAAFPDMAIFFENPEDNSN